MPTLITGVAGDADFDAVVTIPANGDAVDISEYWDAAIQQIADRAADLLDRVSSKYLRVLAPRMSAGYYDGNSLSVSSQTGVPMGIFFKPDGLKMYIVGNAGTGAVYQYTLTTPWRISTASYDTVSFSVAAQETDPYDMWISSDGTKMYVVGGSSVIYQYTLVTPWSLTGAVYASLSLSVAAQVATASGFYFKDDGTKLYVVDFGAGDDINQYTLATPWNISTGTADAVTFSIAGQDTSGVGVFFSSDGAKMFVIGQANDTVYQYTLATPWVISSATYDSVSFSIAGQETAPNGFHFSEDGLKMYVVGTANDRVYEYYVAKIVADHSV
jgi:hypothetical protein